MFRSVDRVGIGFHVRVLGWLVLVSGVLGLLATGCALAGAFAVAATARDTAPRVIVPFLALGMAGFVGTLSAIGVGAGIGLLRRKPWARVLAMVDALLGLVWFPVGTLFALYAFWVLLGQEAAGYFAEAAPEDGSGP